MVDVAGMNLEFGLIWGEAPAIFYWSSSEITKNVISEESTELK